MKCDKCDSELTLEQQVQYLQKQINELKNNSKELETCSNLSTGQFIIPSYRSPSQIGFDLKKKNICDVCGDIIHEYINFGHIKFYDNKKIAWQRDINGKYEARVDICINCINKLIRSSESLCKNKNMAILADWRND